MNLGVFSGKGPCTFTWKDPKKNFGDTSTEKMRLWDHRITWKDPPQKFGTLQLRKWGYGIIELHEKIQSFITSKVSTVSWLYQRFIGSSGLLGILYNLVSWSCFCSHWFMGSSLQMFLYPHECVSEIHGSLVHQHNWVYYIISPLGYASVFHGSWVHRFKSLKCLMSVFQKLMVHWFISTTG